MIKKITVTCYKTQQQLNIKNPTKKQKEELTAKEANILDKVEVNGTANCCITLKDHKANFLNHPTTRLINPAKNEIGRISKQILDQINSTLCEIVKVNKWKNTESVINWFKKFESKS